MKREYRVTGMSCEGCVSNVKKALLNVSNVEAVEVQLSPPIAVLTTSTEVSTADLQAQISKSWNYTIVESIQNSQSEKENQENKKNKNCCCG